MELDNITDNIVHLITECVDETLAIMVVGGYMLGKFAGVDIPIELPLGIIGYYFLVKKVVK